ncbi:DUF1353 domain-containing protein [Phenylobacterium sp.]|uniref:DUF1353 domain-containing protein n=1 Tax=Phenylobacterium sp. TaxID=1871053 RepID=UPI00272F3700|nr:DUF1353 domain-containing protein [Phenylobacterium sp.]MDP2214785.1 DUF1353 domain-containing protein [Phenylobacterium sp.]
MSSFTEELVVRVAYRVERGRRCVEVAKPFAYEVGFLGSGDLVRVPIGAPTDFGSQPRLTWLIDPPFGLNAKADAVHDQLYRDGSRSRIDADRIWWEAMAVEAEALARHGQACAPMWWRYLRYVTVRAFGWRNFAPLIRRPVRRPEVAWGALATASLVVAASAGAWLALVLLLRALT